MTRDDVMKLALEAGFQRDNLGFYQPSRMTPDADCFPELARFAALVAALIVEKCCEKVVEHQPRYLTRGQAQEMADTIKKHFGVEE